MLLRIDHRLEYSFDDPTRFSIHYVRLWPTAEASQTVVDWYVETPGRASPFTDGYGNRVLSVSITDTHDRFFVHARGIIETKDKAGVFGFALDPLPPLYWRVNQGLAAYDEALQAFAAGAKASAGSEPITFAHALMTRIHRDFAKEDDKGEAVPNARAVLDRRRGTPRDLAHLFIAAARSAGLPARFATGYLYLPESGSTTTHEWAEVSVQGLGWVGFDPVHDQSPTERYVRIAVGRDHDEAKALTGLRADRGALTAQVKVSAITPAAKEEVAQQQ